MRTIAAFNHADQAHFLRSRLEGGGIAAYVRNEYTVTLGFSALAAGGIKVDVADEDYEAAMEFLAADEPVA